MNLINDLGSELAFAVLIEKKHRERLHSSDVLPLIGRITEVLQPITAREDFREQPLPIEQAAKVASH